MPTDIFFQGRLCLIRDAFFSSVRNCRKPTQSELIIHHQAKPNRNKNAKDSVVPDIRVGMDNHSFLRQLKPQTIVYHPQHDGATSDPSMQVSEDALPTRLLEVLVLDNAHTGLEDDDCRDSEEADDNMCMHWVLEVVEIVTDSDSERHTADHHDKGYDLDGNVHCCDLIPQISILQVGNTLDWEMEGNGA